MPIFGCVRQQSSGWGTVRAPRPIPYAPSDTVDRSRRAYLGSCDVRTMVVTPVRVLINGRESELPQGSTALDAVMSAGFDIGRIAVEIDGDICPRAELSGRVLIGGESMEIVSFVGGG